LVANSGTITVALDITLTEDLKNEGIARELVNRIQNLRKDSGFEVTDKIVVYLQKNPALEKAVNQNQTYIKSETLTKEIIFKTNIEEGTPIEFEEIKTILTITK
jgi:isoleucyl-tRNA synthetase